MHLQICNICKGWPVDSLPFCFLGPDGRYHRVAYCQECLAWVLKMFGLDEDEDWKLSDVLGGSEPTDCEDSIHPN